VECRGYWNKGNDDPGPYGGRRAAEDTPAAVRQALAKKYPILEGKLVPLAHRLRHYDTVHYELSASEPTVPRTGGGE
jgi:hypothetical protein